MSCHSYIRKDAVLDLVNRVTWGKDSRFAVSTLNAMPEKYIEEDVIAWIESYCSTLTGPSHYVVSKLLEEWKKEHDNK